MKLASLVLWMTLLSVSAHAAAIGPRPSGGGTYADPHVITAAAGSGGAAVSGRPGANGSVAGKAQPNGNVSGTRGK